MIRFLVTLIVLVAAAYGGLAFYYGATEPCDMLAQEMANQNAEALGLGDEGFLADANENLSRMATGNMSSRECVDDLWRAWFDS